MKSTRASAPFATFVIGTAVFMIAAMWVFPEAGVKKSDVKRGEQPAISLPKG